MRVLDHVTQSLSGVIRVERKICATCVHHSQLADHHLESGVQADADDVAPAHADGCEAPCSARNSLGQLCVGESRIRCLDRDGLRMASRCGVEYFAVGR